MNKLSRAIGVDLGGSKIKIWASDVEEILVEDSCMSLDVSSKKVLEVGSEARAMSGRVGKGVEIVKPIKRGVVADSQATTALLKILFSKLMPSKLVLSTKMMASVPASATEADKQAITKILFDLGAQEVYTIAQPLAAAIGAGVPIADASGSFFMQMGESWVEAAVVSLGSMVAHQETEYAGAYLREAISYHLKTEKNIKLSQDLVEKLITKVASATEDARFTMMVTGQDLATGSPKELEIVSADLYPVVMRVMGKYYLLLEKLLSQVPPELTVDVIDKGLLLSGGLAQLDGLEQYLTQRMGIPVAVVDEPETAVIRGVATALKHIELFKESLGYQVD